MVVRWVCVVAVCLGLASARAVHAADIYAQLFPLTGEVRLLNKDASPIPFVYYSITSESGALDALPSQWKSITQNYDAPFGSSPGNGLIDPDGEWIKLSSTSAELTEGSLDIDGGSLPAYRAISLGLIWNPHVVPFPDLEFVAGDDLQTHNVIVELALDGDFSRNNVVDAGDYILWRRYVDSMTAWFADGDLDGVVDMDDYLVWQANFGVTLPLPPYEVGSGGLSGGVPEPTSAVLVLLSAAALPVALRRRVRRS